MALEVARQTNDCPRSMGISIPGTYSSGGGRILRFGSVQGRMGRTCRRCDRDDDQLSVFSLSRWKRCDYHSRRFSGRSGIRTLSRTRTKTFCNDGPVLCLSRVGHREPALVSGIVDQRPHKLFGFIENVPAIEKFDPAEVNRTVDDTMHVNRHRHWCNHLTLNH